MIESSTSTFGPTYSNSPLCKYLVLLQPQQIRTIKISPYERLLRFIIICFICRFFFVFLFFFGKFTFSFLSCAFLSFHFFFLCTCVKKLAEFIVIHCQNKRDSGFNNLTL